MLAGSASIAAPSATAYADTVPAKCGDTVTAKRGDQISTPFGVQSVTDGVTSLVGGLLGGLCKITVNIVDTAVAPLPVAGQAAAGAVDGAVSSTTNGVSRTIASAGASRTPAKDNPGDTPAPVDQPSTPAATVPQPNSPVPAQEPVSLPVLPFESYGYAPSRDYSDIPYSLAALWSPSPGLRYGDEIPGYGPESGTLGTGQPAGDAVQNAGRAEALAGAQEQAPFPLGAPALAAVLAVSAVAAALVRTWVQRNTH